MGRLCSSFKFGTWIVTLMHHRCPSINCKTWTFVAVVKIWTVWHDAPGGGSSFFGTYMCTFDMGTSLSLMPMHLTSDWARNQTWKRCVWICCLGLGLGRHPSENTWRHNMTQPEALEARFGHGSACTCCCVRNELPYRFSTVGLSERSTTAKAGHLWQVMKLFIDVRGILR